MAVRSVFTPGSKVGRYLLIKLVDRLASRVTIWECLCECGETVTITSDAIRKSRGYACQRSHTLKVSGVTASKTREYWIWRGIRRRCNNPSSRPYPYYGGRGIKVCDRWEESFANFLADMGPRPSPDHSIDRIDNDGDYCPENCKWSTKKEQARNTRRATIIEFDGRKMSLPQWCELLGVPAYIVRVRINQLGWTFVEAVTTPLHEKVKATRRADGTWQSI
jgi:hypothetical protein